MISNKEKKKVLFICKQNSARSQMAEGLLKSEYEDIYEVYSAGSDPGTLNPYAIKVMVEMDIDISNNRPKSLKEFDDVKFDYVVTVCSGEGEACPFFLGGKRYMHVPFDDPAAFQGTDEEKLLFFRKIRDEIKEWITETFKR